ncbi:hypothetical protein [Blastococcus brunescens]|uniref:Uncharacterized protein n=1 Tax=Blastococcus brunescens TaxID=1564165 RepID=A0ABZ1B5W7_9ACTN|nr:hypothetical protein [Blastococcus sp. BMG 8361]WRL65511.1 hypothetical protein U6N30_07905 [Blastococcus sp. BMG 8361]
MALNTWWTADPAQRYWMEITLRDDLGANLKAPKLNAGVWSYDLVGEVKPGDRVLHWSGKARALVGWSDVMESATTVPEYTWQPRGTSGRALPGPAPPKAGLRRSKGFPTSRSPRPRPRCCRCLISSWSSARP